MCCILKKKKNLPLLMYAFHPIILVAAAVPPSPKTNKTQHAPNHVFSRSIDLVLFSLKER